VVPRLVAALTRERGFGVPRAEDFGGAVVAVPEELGGRYRDVFTGAEVELRDRVEVREVFRDFPVALLERVG
jgi:maltooligosyltrehalose synthase